MKRPCLLLSLALVLALLLGCSAALADDLTDYYLDEFGVSVPLPVDYAVITRDTQPDDPLFADIDISYDAATYYMEAAGVYLDALNGDREIYVGLSEAMLDFADYPDEQLQMVIDGISQSAGNTLTKSEIYRVGDLPYILLWKTFDNGQHTIDCYTMHGGVYIGFAISTKADSLSDADSALVMSIADGIVFDCDK